MGLATSADTDQGYDLARVQRDFDVPVDNTGEILLLRIGDESLEYILLHSSLLGGSLYMIY